MTYQSLNRRLLDFWQVILLMLRADRAMVWADHVTIDLQASGAAHEVDVAYRKLARDLLPSMQRRREMRLEELLVRHAPPERLYRVQFVKLAASRLAGRLRPVDHRKERRLSVSLRTRLRTYTQRAALGKLSNSELETPAVLVPPE